MSNIVTDALVLRFANYRDNDRMVTLLSPGMGRIDAIARGCRRAKSALMNAAEPFCAGEYVLSFAHERYSISQCQIKSSFYELRTDYDKLVHGFYWLSLLESAAMPGEPAQGLFHLALRALAHLNYTDLPPAMLTAAFEMHFVAIQGYSPRMDACVVCGKPVSGPVRFDAWRGGVCCPNCSPVSPFISEGARRIMYKLPRVPFDSVGKLEGHPDWPEAARLFRGFVEQRMERRPKTTPPLP